MLLAALILPAMVFAFLAKDTKWLVLIPVGLCLLALLIAALPLKRRVTPQQWGSEPERHLLGTEGPFDWDDATSVTLADPRMAALRGSLLEFHLLETAEKRKAFESIVAALKRGEIPDL